MKQRKNVIVLFVLLLCSVYLFAVPACPDSIQVTQSDGTKLWTCVHGDEYYNWRSTTDGKVILRDEQKYYRYAVVEGDSLVPSKIMVHNLQNRTAEEKAFINNNAEIVHKFVMAEQQVALLRKKAEVEIYEPTPITTQTVLVGKYKKILTILMEFKDRPFTKTVADFDNLMNLESGTIEGNVCSVRKFFEEDSYGRLDVSSVVVGPFMANFKSSYYEKGKNDNTQTTRELVREAIHRASESGVDFSQLDGDGDGYVDCVHIVFAGHGMGDGSEDGLIWEHQSSLVSAIIRDGKKAKQYIITPELAADNRIAPIGTICHEFGHILGAPDFYDTENDTYYATGNYDLMADGSWGYPYGHYIDHGRYPAHTNAYVKCYIWNVAIPVTQITPVTKIYTLQPSTNSPVFYRVNTSKEGEFFLLENRVKQKSDVGIPNEGLVIYHIHKDLSATIGKSNDINSRHPLMCYIVNASAKTNPTNDYESYGLNDTYRSFPGLSRNKTAFTISSTPSFTAWNGTGTGVNLCFIKQNLDKSVSFTVNPQIEGPDQLCKERMYSVTGVVPDKDTIVWSYKTDIKPLPYTSVLKFPNGNKGASVAVKRGAKHIMLLDSIPKMASNNATQPIVQSEEFVSPLDMAIDVPYVGTVTLCATVHSGNGTYTIEKKIELPENIKPRLSALPNMWAANTTRHLVEIGCPDVEDEYIKWYVTHPQDSVTHELTGRAINVTPTKRGRLTIRIVNDCGCPTKNDTTYTFSVITGAVKPPLSMKSYQNPVNTSSMSIVIERNEDEETDAATFAVQEDLPTYTIELWSELQGRVRTLTSNAENVSLDVAGLPCGWYQLLLLQDGQLLDSGNVLLTH